MLGDVRRGGCVLIVSEAAADQHTVRNALTTDFVPLASSGQFIKVPRGSQRSFQGS